MKTLTLISIYGRDDGVLRIRKDIIIVLFNYLFSLSRENLSEIRMLQIDWWNVWAEEKEREAE